MSHSARLEKVFKLVGKKSQAKKCDVMADLLEEGNGIIEDAKEGTRPWMRETDQLLSEIAKNSVNYDAEKEEA